MKYKKTYLLIFSILLCFFINNFTFAASSIESSSVNLINNENIDNTLDLECQSCVLLDEDYDKVLYEKNAYTKMYPASTTKTMTAILTMEKCDLTSIVNVSYYAVHSVPSTYSIANLQPGESFTVLQLLNTLMIASANDSAYVLAQYIANGCNNNYLIDSSQSAKNDFENSINKFSDMMNSKAEEIGCKNTHFVNPNGIQNDNHYSTAYDLALIGKFARTFPTIISIAQSLTYNLPSTTIYTGESRTFNSTNILLHTDRLCSYKYATGLKTGYTDDAKYCIIATATKDDRNLIAVVLHAENTNNVNNSREADCKKLFEYGFNQYSLKSLINQNDVVTSSTVFNGSDETKYLNLISSSNLKALLKNGETIDLNPQITINKLIAPIAKGQKVGSITYTIDDKTYCSDLVAEHDVYASNYLIIVWILLGIFAILLFIVTSSEIKKSKRPKNYKRKK